MEKLADIFGEDSPVLAYLSKVAAIHREAFGDALIGLYLHGSVVQGDFRPGLSDLDILGVVSGGITRALREGLVARLSHESLPVPAFGLELILCVAEAVHAPIVQMPYEFALSTGPEWGVQMETDGTTSDILIHMQLCREAGVVLAGVPASAALAPIPPHAIRAALMGEMLWHRNDIGADPSDQALSNAVLNAARSCYAAETGKIISKTEGGEWWMAREPDDLTVSQALSFRQGRRRFGPDVRSAQRFVELAISRL
ncbi:MAG: aminoglycoside adenylyltransferase domain-containing protein [Pseudomonadota bacterium]